MITPHSRVCAQESCIPHFDDNQLETRFECPICLQCLKDPVLTPCGHRFCNNCIHVWLRSKGQSCPVDGHKLNETDLFPDNFTRREIQDLGERLLQHNEMQQNNQEVENPENINTNSVVDCTFKEFGCLETFPKNTLPSHLESQTQAHLNFLATAFKASIQAQQIEIKSQEANFWDTEAKGECSKSETYSEPVFACQGLLRALYERIVMLEQRNHEQDIQITNLRQQLSSIPATISAGIERLSQELLMRHSSGVLIWTINHFTQKLNSMSAAPSQCMEYSPSFYTAPTGYRFCARLNISPKEHDHLALLIHLKKGDNDAYLDWPFSGRISITLINHLYPHLHLRETMMSRPELDAFKQPHRDMNPRGFGYTEFISVHDLRQQGFLHEDHIVVKIQIQCV